MSIQVSSTFSHSLQATRITLNRASISIHYDLVLRRSSGFHIFLSTIHFYITHLNNIRRVYMFNHCWFNIRIMPTHTQILQCKTVITYNNHWDHIYNVLTILIMSIGIRRITLPSHPWFPFQAWIGWVLVETWLRSVNSGFAAPSKLWHILPFYRPLVAHLNTA